MPPNLVLSPICLKQVNQALPALHCPQAPPHLCPDSQMCKIKSNKTNNESWRKEIAKAIEFFIELVVVE
uniref:Uncharacterized protein n=1 Tax=Physcomitrium patens TaxID=3218 RepID=A0A2K1KM99_PHYPA|nr:hypothetical protein PHYPA_005787 [Physcomitrium patens]